MSMLIDHARYELELIGEDPETIAWYLKVIEAFTSFGHSGGTAMVTIPVLNKLLLCRNLTDFTDDSKEWMHISGEVWGGKKEDGIWQSRRDPEVFSEDGGATYYRLSEGGNSNAPRHNAKHKELA